MIPIIPTSGLVTLLVYDVNGSLVETVINEDYYHSGTIHSIQWNATNNSGQKVNSGIYLYTIKAGDFRQTKKINYIK